MKQLITSFLQDFANYKFTSFHHHNNSISKSGKNNVLKSFITIGSKSQKLTQQAN